MLGFHSPGGFSRRTSCPDPPASSRSTSRDLERLGEGRPQTRRWRAGCQLCSEALLTSRVLEVGTKWSALTRRSLAAQGRVGAGGGGLPTCMCGSALLTPCLSLLASRGLGFPATLAEDLRRTLLCSGVRACAASDQRPAGWPGSVGMADSGYTVSFGGRTSQTLEQPLYPVHPQLTE